jgi:hypothetical protein
MIWFYAIVWLGWIWWFDLWTQIGWMLYGAVLVWPLMTIIYFHYFYNTHERQSRLKEKEDEESLVDWYMKKLWYMRFAIVLLIILLAIPIWIFV